MALDVFFGFDIIWFAIIATTCFAMWQLLTVVIGTIIAFAVKIFCEENDQSADGAESFRLAAPSSNQ